MNDDTAVRAVLDDLYAAWADNDADAFVASFAPEATSALPGSYRPNRDVIREQMAAGFAGRLKGSTVIDEVRGVRFLGADVAVLTSNSAVRFENESAVPADRWVLATWVLARSNGRWLVEAYHNCPAETS